MLHQDVQQSFANGIYCVLERIGADGGQTIDPFADDLAVNAALKAALMMHPRKICFNK